MLDCSKIINQPSFNEKFKGMLSTYRGLKQVEYDGTSFYGLAERLEVLADAFDGQLLIDTAPEPLNNSKFIVIKATLYLATDSGFQPVLSRHGRSSKNVIYAKGKPAQDLDKFATNNALSRVLEAIGMPSVDINNVHTMGEYEALTVKLNALGMKFETAVVNYNMNKDNKGNNVADIKKNTIDDLNVDELRRLMCSLLKLSDIQEND